MSKSDWQEIAEIIGPLRYQSSETDCVPVTVINAILVVYQRQLPTALVKQIWALGVDFDEGTGFVGTHALAAFLDVWFKTAVSDRREKTAIGLSSRIITTQKVSLGPGNVIARTLNGGGVCCLTIKGGCHYVLLLAIEKDEYLIFDPGWNAKYQKIQHKEKFSKYFGLVNRSFSREEFERELKHKYNKQIHIIAHTS